MRRFVNFFLILVVLAAVGYLFYKAKLYPRPASLSGSTTPTAAPVAVRSSLRISVAQRPEALIVSALQRLLDAENLDIEIVEFRDQTSWMELAAGELDLVLAPVGEAVTAQARYDVGRFLFISGQSQGYDVILAPTALTASPNTLGVSGGHGRELFAISKFPDARLVNAQTPEELQLWLQEGAIQAALLESASLPAAAVDSNKTLGATSQEAPMPSVVVLSRALLSETPETSQRIEVLLRALESWATLIDYLGSQPELLRSTLKPDAEAMGIDLDTLLKDYRFLTLDAGRKALLATQEKGLLKQTFDLLVLARTRNLTTPRWEETLTIPDYLQGALVASGPSSPEVPASPIPEQTAPPPPTPEELVPSASPTSSASALGTHHYAGVAPSDPWPDPTNVTSISGALDFSPAVTGEQIGVATSNGLIVLESGGNQKFVVAEGGAPVAEPRAEQGVFYLMQAGKLSALDSEGNPLWSYKFEGEPHSGQLTLTNSDVVFTLGSGSEHHVLAVSRQTGAASWQTKLGAAPSTPPVFALSPQPMLVLLDEKGGCQGLDATSGQQLWQSSLGGSDFLEPAVFEEVLALPHADGTVRLISLRDGSETWKAQLGTALSASATLTDQHVLVPAKDSYLYALSRKDGSIKEKSRLSVPLSSPAVVLGDHVYCCDEQGGVHSLTLPDLKLKWSKSLGKGAVSGPVFSDKLWALLGSDGRLVVYQR